MSLRRKILSRSPFGSLEPGEHVILLLMGAHVLVLMAAYTIAKVLRDAMFLTRFGSEALPYGYLAVAVVAVGMTAAAPHVRFLTVRSRNFAQWFALAASLAAAILHGTGWTWLPAFYYVWVGSQAMLLISQFWVLALDSWDARRARTLFPLLAGCGLIGGMMGGGFARWGAHRLGDGGLLWVAFGLLCLVRVLTVALGARTATRPLTVQDTTPPRLSTLFTSKHLVYLTIALFLGVMVGTLVDFQFKTLAQQRYTEPEALTRFLGGFYGALSGLSLLVQFGLAGWALRRLGPAAAGALQPLSVLVLAGWIVASPAWAVVYLMRAVQGLIAQTLGKPTSEIYFMAVRPPERRRIKPALDVLVERGADALVGVLILVLLRTVGMDMRVVAALSVLASAAWLAALWRLRRTYVRAFKEMLAAPWVEAEARLDVLRDEQALASLSATIDEALAEHDEGKTVTALRLAAQTNHRAVVPAVRRALSDSADRVRAEAIRALTTLRVRGEDATILPLVDEEDEALARAATEYVLRLGRDAVALVDRVLADDALALRTGALEVLRTHPALARGRIDAAWVDAHIARGSVDALVEASLVLSLLPRTLAAERLRSLLAHPDLEVRRAAFGALALRPERSLLPAALEAMADPALSWDARRAIVAFGDAAVPVLAREISTSSDPDRQAAAAATLARLGSWRAARVLRELTRGGDPVVRYLGFRNLNRIVLRAGRPVLPRKVAERMFLRELRDYRASAVQALALPRDASPALGLLAASYDESTDRAVERACRALACAHDPRPFRRVYEGLRAGSSREELGRSIEYLSHLLPYRAFRPVKVMFEERDGARDRIEEAPELELLDVATVVRRAWETGDAWLRACALRAAREMPGFDRRDWTAVDGDDPIVLVEIERC